MKDGRHLSIAGRVQGVAYRWFTSRQAEALGVLGTVRNLPDGRVEALVVAETVTIEQLLDRLRQGPPMARVDSIEQTPLDEATRRRIEASGRFEILR
ncbi:MAG: acylphosphatase [Acidobacteriota bacterium]